MHTAAEKAENKGYGDVKLKTEIPMGFVKVLYQTLLRYVWK